MSNQTQAVATKEEQPMEYVPFGAEDKIKLSIAIIKNIVAVKTKTGRTCSDADAIKFMMMCRARKLDPFEGDAFLIGYDGKDGPSFSLITAHQAFLKRAELNKEYDGMESGIIVVEDDQLKELPGDFHSKAQEVVGGWATVYFKNRAHPMHKRVRLSRFQKSWGIWQDDPGGMVCKCAEADALRSSFPTMLGGLYLREEQAHTAEEPKVVAPIFSTPAPETQPEMVDVTPEEPPQSAPTPAVSPSKLAKEIRAMMVKEKVSELQIVEFVCGLGVADNCKTLEELHSASETALAMVKSQFADIAKRAKAAQEEQP